MRGALFWGLLMAIVIVSGCVSSSDPFGEPPKGTSPNCGPEDRYKFNTSINSEENFVDFIKTNTINEWVRLDNFRESSPVNGEIDWNKVLEAVKTEKIGSRTIYALDYTPQTCGGFTLKMTNDGYVSVYGCCGI